MASVFTRIIKGELPCYKIAEDDRYFAFLDINPIARGHTLVVTKKEIDYIFDHDDETLAGLLVFSKRIARAIEKVIPCNRIGLAVVGLEVPHTHLHLVPINSIYDLSFEKPKLKLSKEEFEEIAAAIRKHL